MYIMTLYLRKLLQIVENYERLCLDNTEYVEINRDQITYFKSKNWISLS